jgi:hypothetical protein
MLQKTSPTEIKLDKVALAVFTSQGQLHDGLEVAVKRCFELPCSRNQMDFQDLEFQNEICFLGKLQHTNVVQEQEGCIWTGLHALG